MVHVDDLLAVGDADLRDKVMNSVTSRFTLKDLGPVSQYLGIAVKRNDFGNYEINQAQYIETVIREAKLENAKGSQYPLDPGYFKIEDHHYLSSNEE